MPKVYQYCSLLAPYITKFIDEKRSLGYVYDSDAYILKHFDNYCIENALNSVAITKRFLDGWMMRRSSESMTYQTRRISAVRGLMKYMNISGAHAYIPHHFSRNDTQIPHIMSEKEIIAFFEVVDAYSPKTRYIRMANEYRILFRIIYCCGLRNSEACNLKASEVDLSKGTMLICHSKGDNDRIVYLSDDLTELCHQYICYIKDALGYEPYWFFPSSEIDKPFRNSNIDRKFNDYWNLTPYASSCDRKPTVHGLRHAFVVRRMNKWMEQEINLNVMMPYLSSYLGHKGADETFYYYHQTEEAFRIIGLRDTVSNDVIPEVCDEE